MKKVIYECLKNKHDSYILPFLWLHGEPQERVKEEILAIYNSGIREFCAESRPYEKFCQDEWWEDFGFILETARELGMGVWLLDDRAFPTGYANGYLEKEENAHLRKRLAREFQIDAIGPQRGSKFYVGGRVFEGERVIKVIAYRYKKGTDGEELDPKTAVDLTEALDNGMVYWDVPKGFWRVCVVVETRVFAHKDDRFFYYIDMLSKDSCHAMIDAIYKPHYQHFSEYFGSTFKGFFSDEPGFLNVLNTYNNKLGDMESPFPWSDELPSMIAKSSGVSEDEAWMLLPALWEDLGDKNTLMRAHYMDAVTRLYRENFSFLLGNWCRSHGVKYIGHVIEDMGAHTRLGYGSGHYFRALDGQDMGGVDIVLMQDIPGISSHIHRAPLADGGAADPAFFRYTLPKLASSHSHIQPKKKNRAMCEIFGAFGWAEGLPFMKGLADIMLVSGINYFVPHAFSPKENDTDCPPHFYNGGKNHQYPLFKNLMEYMGRCSHMLTGGKHKADVAVFYNAEGEWTGEKCQMFSTLCRILTQNLIDFDIIPYDYLKDAKVENGRLYVNKEDYGALIVSECEALPVRCLKCFDNLAKDGLPVIFTDTLPSRIAEGGDIAPLLKNLKVTSTKRLPTSLKAKGLCHVRGKGKGLKELRFYHVEKKGCHVYLFSNEGITNDVDAQIFLKQAGECLIYEPWHNKCYRAEAQNGVLDLHIEKGNMLFVIFGEEIPKGTPRLTRETDRIALDMRFDIYGGMSIHRKLLKYSPLIDLTAPDWMANLKGEVAYESTFDSVEGYNVIDLGQVGETAEVWLNGVYIGERINAPYKFSMAKALKSGENRLRVVVRNNLAHRNHDWLSSFMQIPPTGLLGPICLCKYEKEK